MSFSNYLKSAAKIDVELNCPFCEGQIAIGKFSDPRTKSQKMRPGVVHSLPPCSKYSDMNMDDFLRKGGIERPGKLN